MKYKIVYLIDDKPFMFEEVYSLNDLYSIIVFSLGAKIDIKVYCTIEARLPVIALLNAIKKPY